MAISFLLTLAIIFIPALRDLFSFAEISFAEYLLAVALGLCIIPVSELVKFVRRRSKRFAGHPALRS